MASQDGDFLFTNIPLEETFDIFTDNLYNENENPLYIPIHNFHNYPNIATKNHFLCLTKKIMNK